MFIELHRASDNAPILVNEAHIVLIREVPEGSRIELIGQENFAIVTENADQVKDLIEYNTLEEPPK